MTVAVEASNKAFRFPARCRKIDGKSAAAGLQNSSFLLHALFARFAGQVMKHDGGQHGVELSIGER